MLLLTSLFNTKEIQPALFGVTGSSDVALWVSLRSARSSGAREPGTGDSSGEVTGLAGLSRA